MLIFKLQRHTFGIKSSRNQESSEHTKIKTVFKIQKTIGTSREIDNTSSPKYDSDLSSSSIEACETLFGSLASTKNPRDSDEEAHSSHDALWNLPSPDVLCHLDGLTLTELANFHDLLESSHVVSKLEANIEKARIRQSYKESPLVCDLKAEKTRLLKDVVGLQDLARLAKSIRKVIEDDLDLLCTWCRRFEEKEEKAMLVGRSQALMEVVDSGIGLELESMKDYDLNAKEAYDRAIDAFYLTKFPYVDLLVHYSDQSVWNHMTLKPPIIPFGNASCGNCQIRDNSRTSH
ncbi:hypothetical protein Tco_0569550 [Tanacetum coccineum]